MLKTHDVASRGRIGHNTDVVYLADSRGFEMRRRKVRKIEQKLGYLGWKLGALGSGRPTSARPLASKG